MASAQPSAKPTGGVAGIRMPGFLRRIPEPTLAGHVTLTFLVVGLPMAVSLRNNPLLLAICALLATLVASFFVTWLASGQLSIERRLPMRVMAGEPFEVRVRVTNISRWCPAFGIGFRDALQIDSSGEVTCGPILPMLAPRATIELTYTKRIHRRGIYNVSNALVASRFPLGVFEHRALLSHPSRIIVLPPIGRLKRPATRQLATRPADRARRLTVQEGQDEFHSLREYRPGENPRLIHWRTSARTQTLVRRVMKDSRSENLVILLDTALAQRAESRHLEAAISCAATLLVHAQKRGCKATVLFRGGRAAHSGTRSGLFGALETLASIGADDRPVAPLLRQVRDEGAAQVVCLAVGSSRDELQRSANQMRLKLLVWDVREESFGEIFQR